MLQIEHKELKNFVLKQEEQKEIVEKRLELLNIENGDLRKLIQTLEDNIRSTQGERDALHDNLRKTSEMCSQLESTLSSFKHEETNYERKIDELRLQLNHVETASAEKDDAMQDLVIGLQSQLSESRSQLEQLNIENGDLQNVIQSLMINLQSAQGERDRLHDCLRETREMCSQLESTLSSFKETNYERKVDDLQNQLNQTETALAAAILASAEKEKAMQDLVQKESTLQEVINGHEAHISDLTSQISKLIDQLSTVSGEKAIVAAKVDSVTMELSTMSVRAKSQANKISELESAIESLTEERDRLAGTLSSSLSASLLSEKNALESNLNDKETETDELNNLENQIDGVDQNPTRVKSEADARIEADESEKNELEAINTEVAKTITYSPQSTEAIEDLTKDIKEMNSNFLSPKRDHNDEFQQLNAELRELRENRAALEEAIQGDFPQTKPYLRRFIQC